MDRREFIKTGAASIVAASLGSSANGASFTDSKKDKIVYDMDGAPLGDPDSLAVRFLGTGAADWNGKDDRGELRRLTSILIEKSILIDFTPSDLDMIPDDAKPQTVIYTHSHSDHYNPTAAMKLGIKTVYVSDTWVDRAKEDFGKAAEENGLVLPWICGLGIGDQVKTGGITFTALPANHATSDIREQTLMYLIEKGPVRLLYATDTGGIPAIAARIAGIDAHQQGKPVTAMIMEATMGMGHDEDFRIYTHSSAETVLRISHVLKETGRYCPRNNEPVFLTHMARTLHGTQAELDSSLPPELKAAYDGLELIL